MGMRSGRDNGFMFDDKDNLIAVNLGADFTAEHEWGIDKLNRTLGINDDQNVLGIERYRVTLPHPESVMLVEKKKNDVALIIVEPYDVKYWPDRDFKDIGRDELHVYDNKLATAWCESSLGIRSKDGKEIGFIRQIHKAILAKDAAVWRGGGHVFKNSGLMIGIISAIPDKEKQEMYDSHVDYRNLIEASEATGIKVKIDTLNQEFVEQHNGNATAIVCKPYGYSSLRPAWVENRTKDTKHKVVYWLSPYDYKKYTSGWYTVEELEQWIKGEGPVVKSA